MFFDYSDNLIQVFILQYFFYQSLFLPNNTNIQMKVHTSKKDTTTSKMLMALCHYK